MNHGKLLSRAWEITWNYKFLWILGFLASLASGSGFSNSSNFDGGDFFVSPTISSQSRFDLDSAASNPGIIVGGIVAALLFLLLTVVFYIVGKAGRVGLIQAVSDIDADQKITFGEAFKGGIGKVWPIFKMQFTLFFIPFFLVIGIIALVVILGFRTESFGVFALLCPLIFLMIIGGFLLSFTDAYAFREIVFKDIGTIDSIKSGWSIFKANAGDSLILGVIYGLISMAYGMLVSVFMGLFAFFSIFAIYGDIQSGDISSATVVFGGLNFILLSILSAILMSIVTTWQSTGFTLAYLEMTGMSKEPLVEKSPDDTSTIDFSGVNNDESVVEKDPSDIDDGK